MKMKISVWLNKNRGLIELFMVTLTFFMVVATFYQGYYSAQQVKESKRAIDLQYTPQLDIEIDSNRIPVILTETNYSKGDAFEVYKNDLISFQDPSGKTYKVGEVSIPVNITFYNLGSIGTKLDRIRYDFACDPKGEKDWQVDILKNRVIAPREQLTYSNRLFLNFGEIPEENKKCSIVFKFFFYNGFTKEVKYYVRYNNYDRLLPER